MMRGEVGRVILLVSQPGEVPIQVERKESGSSSFISEQKKCQSFGSSCNHASML